MLVCFCLQASKDLANEIRDSFQGSYQPALQPFAEAVVPGLVERLYTTPPALACSARPRIGRRVALIRPFSRRLLLLESPALVVRSAALTVLTRWQCSQVSNTEGEPAMQRFLPHYAASGDRCNEG